MKSIAFDTDIYISTVSISVNKKQPDGVWLFRCYRCGTPLVEIRGNVTNISTGLEPTRSAVLIDQCYHCKEYYTYQNRTTDSDVTKLTLPYYPNQSMQFMCILCRSRLLEYTKDLIQKLPERTLLETPAPFTCWKPDCQRKYLLVDTVAVI